MTLSKVLMPLRRLVGVMVLALAASGAGHRVHASSYVPMSDVDLAASVPLIVRAQVRAIDPGPQPLSSTRYQVQVIETLRGPSAPALTIHVAGAWDEQAPGARIIHGMPRFLPGEQVLLFLHPRADGSWSIAQYFLGQFTREPRADGGAAWVRHLRDARAVSLATVKARVEPVAAVRDAEAFVRWLRDGASTDTSHYWVDGELAPAAQRKFALLEASGNPFRWFAFDLGGAVSWVAHPGGYVDADGNPGAGFDEFQLALKAWNDGGGRIRQYYAGQQTAVGGLNENDDLNAILWEDPNDEIAGSFNCQTGGTLALAGPSARGQRVFQGQEYNVTFEADIVTQNNAGCAFDVRELAAEVFAHELGHTLGFDHPCSDCDALMAAQAKGDGRGAQLGADERDGIDFVYPALTTPTPSAVPSPSTAPSPSAPPTPTAVPTPSSTPTPSPPIVTALPATPPPTSRPETDAGGGGSGAGGWLWLLGLTLLWRQNRVAK